MSAEYLSIYLQYSSVYFISVYSFKCINLFTLLLNLLLSILSFSDEIINEMIFLVSFFDIVNFFIDDQSRPINRKTDKKYNTIIKNKTLR